MQGQYHVSYLSINRCMSLRYSGFARGKNIRNPEFGVTFFSDGEIPFHPANGLVLGCRANMTPGTNSAGTALRTKQRRQGLFIGTEARYVFITTIQKH